MPTSHAELEASSRLASEFKNALMNSGATEILESDKIPSWSFIDIMSSVQETLCCASIVNVHISPKPVHQNEAEVLRRSSGSTVLMNHSPNLLTVKVRQRSRIQRSKHRIMSFPINLVKAELDSFILGFLVSYVSSQPSEADTAHWTLEINRR